MRKWAVIPTSSGSIALDATYSIGASLSGVGVYSRQILFGLAAMHPGQRFLFAYRSHRLLRSFRERLPGNAGRVWLRSDGISPRRCVLFHSLNQRLDSTFPRSVATFHDLFVLTGEYSTPEFRARFAEQARRAAERADLIIAVSQFTASQIIAFLKVEPSRIRVVHHGVTPPPAGPAPRPREKLILHVGAIQARKNLVRLVEAFEHMPTGWKLVLAGSNGYGAEQVLARIQTSARRADIELPGYISQADLEGLYGRAAIFAFPSLDEGFGMPALDAMARGVPVVTSEGSALREVAGDAALLVNPMDVASITDSLLELTGNENLGRELAVRGQRRAAQFTWAQAVSATWSVYQELA